MRYVHVMFSVCDSTMICYTGSVEVNHSLENRCVRTRLCCLLSFCSPSIPECCKDDQRVDGQEVWQLVARGDRWRLWLWGHTWGEEPALHVLWRKPGCVRVEVLVAPPCYASSSLTWSLDWIEHQLPARRWLKLWRGSLSALPATVADINVVWKPCPVLKCS